MSHINYTKTYIMLILVLFSYKTWFNFIYRNMLEKFRTFTCLSLSIGLLLYKDFTLDSRHYNIKYVVLFGN